MREQERCSISTLWTNLKCIKNLQIAKTTHNIRASILVILVEDEINVIKSKISCSCNSDNLINFCGARLDHHYVNNFLLVAIRKVGYNKILDVFTNKIIEIFVTILIVNPLHEKLLILVLVVCFIYNCFDVNWVQQQWDVICVSWVS